MLSGFLSLEEPAEDRRKLATANAFANKRRRVRGFASCPPFFLGHEL
jgi:hypothetical protein